MQLAAGQLTLQYENGFLRWITAGKDEVLRMIYFAVRDKNWSTVTGVVMNEKIEHNENSFIVSYEMLFEQDEIKIHFHATIEGKEDNSIVFEIKGTSLTAFKKNRIGFCILHPIKECAGKKVWITHSDKSIEENIFPLYISPHQPFKNIAAMQCGPVIIATCWQNLKEIFLKRKIIETGRIIIIKPIVRRWNFRFLY